MRPLNGSRLSYWQSQAPCEDDKPDHQEGSVVHNELFYEQCQWTVYFASTAHVSFIKSCIIVFSIGIHILVAVYRQQVVVEARRDVEALLFRQAIPRRFRLIDPCGEEALLLHRVQDNAAHGHFL